MKIIMMGLLITISSQVLAQDNVIDNKVIYGSTGTIAVSSGLSGKLAYDYITTTNEALYLSTSQNFYKPLTFAYPEAIKEQGVINSFSRINNEKTLLIIKASPLTQEAANEFALIQMQGEIAEKKAAIAEGYSRIYPKEARQNMIDLAKKQVTELKENILKTKTGKLNFPFGPKAILNFKVAGKLGPEATKDFFKNLSSKTFVQEVVVKDNVDLLYRNAEKSWKWGKVSGLVSIASLGSLIYEVTTSGGLSRALGINEAMNSSDRLTGKEVEDQPSFIQKIISKVNPF